MEKIRGFMEHRRADPVYQPASSRVQHYREFEETYDQQTACQQATRCMDCGVPFCQGDTGCPVENLIPEFNDLVFRGLWKDALESLHSTNNFPEFTGRLCPAPCETACVLGITDPPVSIKAIERSIIDHGFAEGWVEPQPPVRLTGKTVAIVGSGPAGLACAQQLARVGHRPTLFEKQDQLGGLLRYGIPDFKMEKWHIDRRIEQMQQEGVIFKAGAHVGVSIEVAELLSQYDALVLAIGAEEPYHLNIPGSNLKGVHYAMDYLTQANRVAAGELLIDQVDAKGKDVIVIGGGDTGSDCIGIANRQGAKSIINFRRSEKPPRDRPAHQPWPLYPDIFYSSSSHEEGVERHFAIRPIRLHGRSGQVKSLEVSPVRSENGHFVNAEAPNITWRADLVLLAMGYSGPVRSGLIEELVAMGLELDKWGAVQARFGNEPGSFATSLPRIYVCGDARRGQSLIVWAISEGRKCAAQVHRDLAAQKSSPQQRLVFSKS